ncbi:MAG: GWxTD domain-containing protein [Crocinitomicaceae bacterium]
MLRNRQFYSSKNAYLCWIIITILLSACSINRYGDGYTIPEQKKVPTTIKFNEIPLDYVFYYPDTLQTNVYFTVDPGFLLFSKDPLTNDELSAKATITCSFYESPSKRDAIEKQSKTLESFTRELIHDSLLLPHGNKDIYYELTITDLNNQTSDTKTGWLKKQTEPTTNQFLFYSDNTEYPLNRDKMHEFVRYVRSDYYKNEPLQVSLYRSVQQPAPPPFSTRLSADFSVPDTTFELSKTGVLRKLNIKNSSLIVVGPKQTNTPKTGICQAYLHASNIQELIPTMLYISTRDEFQQLQDTTQMRIEFEHFWLARAQKDQKIAQKLIARYFGRVNYANEHFSSFKPGWQTDRGIIYIVFGAPDIIDIQENTLIWKYGNQDDNNGLMFKFYKEPIFFLDNNYTLERTPYFKPYWYQAVENWRAGNVGR